MDFQDLIGSLNKLTLGSNSNPPLEDETECNIAISDVIGLWKDECKDVDIVCAILRAFRKLFATQINPESLGPKRDILMNEFIVRTTYDNLKNPLINQQHAMLKALTLQFHFNGCQGQNSEFLNWYWSTYGALIFEKCIMETTDCRIKNSACGLVFLQIRDNISNFKMDSNMFNLLIRAMVDPQEDVPQQGCEFAMLALKNYLSHPINLQDDPFPILYNALSHTNDRLALLELISTTIMTQQNLIRLSNVFKARSKLILTALSQNTIWNPMDALEVTNILHILCEGSSIEKGVLQNDPSLLIDAVYLLKMVHDLGKNQKLGEFQPIRKLTQVSGDETDSPTFGFKRDLIRLIGNLCWNHKVNQDAVRDMDGIYLILDCSAIDGKNPFITQWVVFAIHNLTDNNRENQQVIADLEKSGKLDRKLMEESGIILP